MLPQMAVRLTKPWLTLASIASTTMDITPMHRP
jgi:hypothetical protein